MKGWERGTASGAGVGCVQVGRDSWGKLGQGAKAAWPGNQHKVCQERGTKMRGWERGDGKAGTEEGR